MGRSRRKRDKKVEAAQLDSDDEQFYEKDADPDPNSEEFIHDEVDRFHSRREKILLDRGADIEPAGFSSDEEEVLALDSGSDDEEVAEYRQRLRQLKSQGFIEKIASDIEDQDEEEEDEEVSKSWGKKRSKYYGGEVSDNDEDLSGSEPEAAEFEEQEALAMQKRMAEQLEDQDFGLDIFKTVKKPAEQKDEEQKITTDLSQLTAKQKKQLLKKESPELLDLIKDFKVKMAEVQDRLLPVFTLIKKGDLPKSRGTEYVTTKLHLLLNYCVNVTFYLMLKAKRTPVQDHPVVKRLVQYRNLITQMEVADKKAQKAMDEMLETVKSNGDISKLCGKQQTDVVPKIRRRKLLKAATKAAAEKRKLAQMTPDDSSEDEEASPAAAPEPPKKESRKKKKKDEMFETTGEKEALQLYDAIKKAKKGKVKQPEKAEMPEEEEEVEADYANKVASENDLDESDMEEDDINPVEKRAVTYQIAKNKGLTPKRKKEQRNPRVKHREKYRKAKIRRKGAIREPRTEMHRYGGELSGIRASIVKSRKLQ